MSPSGTMIINSEASRGNFEEYLDLIGIVWLPSYLNGNGVVLDPEGKWRYVIATSGDVLQRINDRLDESSVIFSFSHNGVPGILRPFNIRILICPDQKWRYDDE